MLKISDLDLKTGRLIVTRLQSSISTIHPIQQKTLLKLKSYMRDRESSLRTLFINERGDSFDRSSVNCLLKVLSKEAELQLSVLKRYGTNLFAISY